MVNISGAPWVRKFGYLCIQEILFLRCPFVCTYIHPPHSHTLGRNFAFQARAHFGGKLHGHLDP